MVVTVLAVSRTLVHVCGKLTQKSHSLSFPLRSLLFHTNHSKSDYCHGVTDFLTHLSSFLTFLTAYTQTHQQCVHRYIWLITGSRQHISTHALTPNPISAFIHRVCGCSGLPQTSYTATIATGRIARLLPGRPKLASPAAARLTQTRILRPAKDVSDRPLGKLSTLEHSKGPRDSYLTFRPSAVWPAVWPTPLTNG